MSSFDASTTATAHALRLVELCRALEEFSTSPLAVWDTRIQIQKACDVLLAKVMGPMEHAALIAESCQESSAMHFVTSLGIADIIGEGEVTLLALSQEKSVDPRYLGIAMSCLLGRGYFEETAPGSHVYKNNEMSRVLRTGQLREAIGLIGDEGFRATSRLLDAAKVTDGTPRLPASNIAFGFDSSIFLWMSSSEHSWRGERLGKAMQQLHSVANVHVSEDYPWHELSIPIVDIGGGVGALEMSILARPENKHLEFMIFDIPATVANAKKTWKSKHENISSRVSFAPGNFMAPTFEESGLPSGKPVYIIRHVLHDWTDEDVVFLLGRAREAMSAYAAGARLLLVEMLLRPESSRFVRTTSMQLLALNSGVTRTQEEMESLVRKANLRPIKTTHMRAVDSVMECII